MKKILLVIASVLVIAGGTAGYIVVNRDEPQPTVSNNQQINSEPQKEVSYQGIEGRSALDLLKQAHKVETKSYEGLGDLVTGINGVLVDNEHFWSFYINDQQSQVGASAYITKDSDTIKWKLEKVQ